MGRGPTTAKILLLGEAPGEAEARTGEPFRGLAGQFLNKALQELDLLNQVYITNVAKCRPPKNRKPEAVEAEVCSDLYLRKEIDLIKPRVIVALGVTAADFLFRSNNWVRGELKYVERFACQGIVTWHPSYCLRFASCVASEQMIKALTTAKDV